MNDFDMLYREYGPMVLRRCRYFFKDEDKAVDAMQDVFVRLIERKEQIKNVCSSLLYVTATRICLNKIRSEGYRNWIGLEDFQGNLEDTLCSSDEAKINSKLLLEYIFASRDSKDKEIAILHFVDGFTLEETAAKMRMSVSGIRKRIAKLQEFAGELK